MKMDVQWMLKLVKGPKMPGTELNTVHLYQHHSVFMHNKLQYTWRGDYCERMQPAQLPVLTWRSSCVPPGTTSTIRSRRDRAGYNINVYRTYTYRISRPIRRTVIFSLEISEKNNDECILILVIYWKKTGLLHTKISNHNIIYSS